MQPLSPLAAFLAAAAFPSTNRAPILSVRDTSPRGTVESVRSRKGPRVGRNQRCPCGSGKKHKHCCRG